MNYLESGIYTNPLFPCPVVLVQATYCSAQQNLKFVNLFGASEYMVVKHLDITTAAIIQFGLEADANKEILKHDIVALVRMDKFTEGKPAADYFLKALNEKHAEYVKKYDWQRSMLELFNTPLPVPA